MFYSQIRTKDFLEAAEVSSTPWDKIIFLSSYNNVSFSFFNNVKVHTIYSLSSLFTDTVAILSSIHTSASVSSIIKSVIIGNVWMEGTEISAYNLQPSYITSSLFYMPVSSDNIWLSATTTAFVFSQPELFMANSAKLIVYLSSDNTYLSADVTAQHASQLTFTFDNTNAVFDTLVSSDNTYLSADVTAQYVSQLTFTFDSTDASLEYVVSADNIWMSANTSVILIDQVNTSHTLSGVYMEVYESGNNVWLSADTSIIPVL